MRNSAETSLSDELRNFARHLTDPEDRKLVNSAADQLESLTHAIGHHKAEWQRYNGTRSEVARPDDVWLWATLEEGFEPRYADRERLERWMLAYVHRFDAGDLTTDEDLIRMAVIADLRAYLDAAEEDDAI